MHELLVKVRAETAAAYVEARRKVVKCIVMVSVSKYVPKHIYIQVGRKVETRFLAVQLIRSPVS